LEGFSDEELLGEIIRRRREDQDRLAKLSITAEGAGKSSRKSQATAQYWQGWYTYKSQHPDASVAEWRKARAGNAAGQKREGL
jgi:hypothetical protein